MADSHDLPRLTDAELDVIKVLWARGRLSAREVHDLVAESQGWAYSTTRTTLERMVRKGLVQRGSFHGLHLYEAVVSRAAGFARRVREFASQVLESSPVPVVSLFAESGVLSNDEVDELLALLEEEHE
jgi:BlaI family transcriptional regulator, penicillinase repressor